jgi:hypothetical protein
MMHLLLLLEAALLLSAPVARAQTPLHQPAEVSLQSASTAAAVSNPFLLELNLTAVHVETGASVVVGGFYDGNATWRARFTCSRAGRWEWHTTVSGGTALAALTQAGHVECLAEPHSDADHGALLVDSAHPHHFIWQDGTRHFPMSYECDWIYALGLEPESTPTTLADFLDSIASGHYNQIVMNFYANHSGWDQAPKEYLVHTKATPWASADQMTLNLDYFQHYDTVLAALQARGIIAHIMIMVENKAVKWPQQESTADDLYWSTVINRYQAFPNVVWDVSKEAHNLAPSYWATRFALIEAKDSHHRLRTVHTAEVKDGRSGQPNFVPLEQKDCQFISHQQVRRFCPCLPACLLACLPACLPD